MLNLELVGFRLRGAARVELRLGLMLPVVRLGLGLMLAVLRIGLGLKLGVVRLGLRSGIKTEVGLV